MENLLVTNDYASLGEAEDLRVVYDTTTDLIWIDEPSLCDWVDLGLPSGTKWASCNVGASAPEDCGLYFAWGETEGYTAEDIENGVRLFTWGDYKYTSDACTGATDTEFRGGLTKYNSKSANGTVDNLTTLELVDDAAYVSDNTCMMPTRDDCQELIDNTSSTWETLNGVLGRRITSDINGKSIFIPSNQEYRNGVKITHVSSEGYCNLWTNSVGSTLTTGSGCKLSISGDIINIDFNIYRHMGMGIRAVKK